jgi:hypothetical protein
LMSLALAVVAANLYERRGAWGIVRE